MGYDKLFELAHSLTMSEKRYCKLLLENNNLERPSKYLVLFTKVLELKKYDQSILLEKLNHSNFSFTHLGADKSYLYQQLMKGLRQFHSGKSARLRVKIHLDNAEILYYKGLYRQCKYELQKARKIAKEHQFETLILEIISWERRCGNYQDDKWEKLEVMQTIKQTISKIENYYSYTDLFYTSNNWRKNEVKIRSEEAKKNINSFMDHQLLQGEQFAQTSAAKIRFLEIKANYYFTNNDKINEYLCNKKIIAIMKELTHYVEDYPVEYTLTYSRYLRLSRIVKPKEFNERLQEFRSIPKKILRSKQESEVLVFALSYGIEMNHYLAAQNYEQADTLIPAIEKGFKTYSNSYKAEFKVSALYRIAYLHICQGRYTKALKNINQILNQFEESVRPDIIRFTKILNLLVHFELGNYGLLRYTLKNTADFLIKRKRMYKTEELFISFLKRSISNRKYNKVKELERLKCQFQKQFQVEFEKPAFDYFPFLAWAQAKLEVKYIADIDINKIDLLSL